MSKPYYCEVCLAELTEHEHCPVHPLATRTRRWFPVNTINLETGPAWIFQRNEGPPDRTVEVSVCIYHGRAYRRHVDTGWGTGVPWYATAPRLDSACEKWIACGRDGTP